MPRPRADHAPLDATASRPPAHAPAAALARTDHDWIDQQEQALCGPRVLTFFLYLSDVEEGGGTRFPYIKGEDGQQLVVQPKKGSAVFWPHGMDHNIWQKDDRTHHEAVRQARLVCPSQPAPWRAPTSVRRGADYASRDCAPFHCAPFHCARIDARLFRCP